MIADRYKIFRGEERMKAYSLIDAAADCMLTKCVRGDRYGNANGLSVWFPPIRNGIAKTDLKEYESLGGNTGWISFLKAINRVAV